MWGSLLLVGSLALGQAGDEVAELKPTVRKLVVALDAPEKSTRDEAERTLLEMGPDVLDLLPEVAGSTPAEVALRLTRIRNGLEKIRGEQAVRGSSVSLQGRHKLSEVLAAIEKQTGNKLVDYRHKFKQKAEDVTLTVDFDNTPFWQALEQVLRDAKLAVYATPDREELPRGMALVMGDKDAPTAVGRVVHAGAFQFEITQTTARRDFRRKQADSLQIAIETRWEPRLAPIMLLQPLEAFHVFDDQGRPLGQVNPTSVIEMNIDPNMQSADISIRLNLPSRDVRRLASIKGRLDALVPGRTETFEFANLGQEKGVEQRRGGVVVTLDQVAKNNELHEVHISVEFEEAAGAFESHRTWIYDNPAFLLNAKGEKIESVGLDVTKQEENGVGMSYLFAIDADLAEHTFVYRTPSAIVSLPIEFELKDIELP